MQCIICGIHLRPSQDHHILFLETVQINLVKYISIITCIFGSLYMSHFSYVGKTEQQNGISRLISKLLRTSPPGPPPPLPSLQF